MKSELALRLVHTKSLLPSPLSTASREHTMSHKASASHFPYSPRFQLTSRKPELKKRKSSSKLLQKNQVSGLRTMLKTQQLYIKERRNLLAQYQSLYTEFCKSISSDENGLHIMKKASEMMQRINLHKKRYDDCLKNCQEHDLHIELKKITQRTRSVLGKLTSKGKI